MLRLCGMISLLVIGLPLRADGTDTARQFPLGIYTSDCTTFDTIVRLGFNLVLGPSTDTDFESAKRHGLRVIPRFFGDDSASWDRMSSYDSDSTVVAWYPFDEPDLCGYGPEVVSEKRERLKMIHGGGHSGSAKPIYMTVWSANQYRRYLSLADIFAVVPYPLRSATRSDEPLDAVYSMTSHARSLTNKPVYAVIQCFVQNPWWRRAPEPDELGNMIAQALIGGADGIMTFIYTIGSADGTIWNLSDHPDLLTEIAKINRGIRSIENVLVDDRSIRLHGKNDSVAITRVSPSRAVYRLIEHDRILYLLLANPFADETSIDFSFRNPVGQPKILFGNRVSQLSNGQKTFHCSIGQYGWAAIRLRSR